MKFPVAIIFFLMALVVANTETSLFRIPYYYDIPYSHLPVAYTPGFIKRLNSSTSLINSYPIGDKLTFSTLSNEQQTISLHYDMVNKPQERLLVKLNNYNNTLFDSNDLINVKLCWPATLPFDFSISHEFIQRYELTGYNELVENTLDIYIVIDYKANFVTCTSNLPDTLRFNLFVNKLPNKLVPIPLELYDYVVYLVDLLILIGPAVPAVASHLFY
ncbi:hypothetical protein HYPBUDRAFT_109017 [Hyphopichia burtonii NRRL Y-1933]|uniref:Uncharacterized protein n=1 Tax=Hyphopichia burtonii NRRL Y-1933 TaxID=984485 RepID=A0A1E4RHP5_9ASCO|nr:hypothetical protein HYPBUDRAFT_109017 [Hyphopichia burtonii NRRL Y-1933]ODV66797.1 hypothetical protein HYPBUDRAFT_109017 [Hyphopichia burtonii NRRL Y-1933]